MTTYQQYMREKDTESRKEALKHRSENKKAKDTTKFFDLDTEITNLAKDQIKARKKASKATNDAELARRSALYSPKKATATTPNPNTAFKRKRSRQGRFFSRPAAETKEIDSILDGLRMRDTPINAPSNVPKSMTWNPKTEHWEPEHEDITITDRDTPPSFSDEE